MSKFKFVWIDDDPIIREPESKNLEKRLKVSIDYKDVMNNDLQNCIAELLNRKQSPNLILIDHKLDYDQSQLFKTGSSVAAVIRDKWPYCPIVCVTGADNIEKLSSINRSLYQEVIPFINISDKDEIILSIAKGFNEISATKYKNLNKIIELLKVPETETTKLKLILPIELKDNYSDHGIATNLSYWVRKKLMKRPGLLYNRLWVATLLGIKETSFKKIEPLFNSAKYKGIFSLESDPRWWKSSVLEVLANKVKVNGLPFEKGRLLSFEKSKITARDFSTSYTNTNETPETVVLLDDSSTLDDDPVQWHPETFKNSEPHPYYPDMLFFDQIRKIKPQE